MSETGSRTCPCHCRPFGASCGATMRGIELTYGQCILCKQGDHWQPGDDEPAFDWPAITATALQHSEASDE